MGQLVGLMGTRQQPPLLGPPALGYFPSEGPDFASELTPAASDPLCCPHSWALVSPKLCPLPSQGSLRIYGLQGLRAGAGVALLCGGRCVPLRMLMLLQLRSLPSCHMG